MRSAKHLHVINGNLGDTNLIFAVVSDSVDTRAEEGARLLRESEPLPPHQPSARASRLNQSKRPMILEVQRSAQYLVTAGWSIKLLVAGSGD
ncbi:hypothetical protein BaRGS_00011953 [Batillaria attramentaria]|uniref:Uncharacterized protein n=1 Tax=Batillaria attramentaria TaxID=370345 RepID=A0ABD0LBG4_9CAEN